jgi:hypothetical protein
MWVPKRGYGAEGVPTAGRIFDAVRWKLSLPPGPRSPYELEIPDEM